MANPFNEVNKPICINNTQDLVQQMMMRNPRLQPVAQFFQNGGNPQVVLQNILNQNPQARLLMNQMQNSGLSAEQYVRNLAKQYNVNIEPIIQSFRNKGFK